MPFLSFLLHVSYELLLNEWRVFTMDDRFRTYTVTLTIKTKVRYLFLRVCTSHYYSDSNELNESILTIYYCFRIKSFSILWDQNNVIKSIFNSLYQSWQDFNVSNQISFMVLWLITLSQRLSVSHNLTFRGLKLGIWTLLKISIVHQMN